MEKKPPLKMTTFDSMVTNETLQMIKVMLPYMPLRFQRMAGMYVKFSEFQNAIYYFQPPYYHSRRGRLRQKELSMTSILEDVMPYMSEEEAGQLDTMSQMLSMMEVMGAMQENTGSSQGGGMDFSEMAKQMLTPEQQAMFDMMDVFQSERMENDERMDEQRGDQGFGSAETGTNQSGSSTD